jgi:hypothetical protein
MTESMTTPAERPEEERPRCMGGYRRGEECWREATERIIADRGEPDACAEHYQVYMAAQEAREWREALDKFGAWIAAEVDSEVENTLMRPAYEMREKLEEAFWRAYVAKQTAERIANLEPGERLAPEGAREFTELFERLSSLGDAITILENAPEEIFGRRGRWHIIAGLLAVKETVSDEVDRCRREIGLR